VSRTCYEVNESQNVILLDDFLLCYCLQINIGGLSSYVNNLTLMLSIGLMNLIVTLNISGMLDFPWYNYFSE